MFLHQLSGSIHLFSCIYFIPFVSFTLCKRFVILWKPYNHRPRTETSSAPRGDADNQGRWVQLTLMYIQERSRFHKCILIRFAFLGSWSNWIVVYPKEFADAQRQCGSDVYFSLTHTQHTLDQLFSKWMCFLQQVCINEIWQLGWYMIKMLPRTHKNTRGCTHTVYAHIRQQILYAQIHGWC